MVAQHMLRTHDVKSVFFERKKMEFDESFDVTKCLQQIEIPDIWHTCAPRSELPSNVSTMIGSLSSISLNKNFLLGRFSHFFLMFLCFVQKAMETTREK